MKNGIDYKALRTELETLGPDERRASMRRVADWMRASSKAVGFWVYLGPAISALGALLALAAALLRTEAKPLILAAIVCLAAGTWINLASNRRAQQWRQANPFDRWRQQGFS